MRIINHESIVKLYEVYEDAHKIKFVMENIDGHNL